MKTFVETIGNDIELKAQGRKIYHLNAARLDYKALNEAMKEIKEW